MKVVLNQDIKNLGKKGDIKDISEGYARNFVLPNKLAVIATPEAIQEVEIEKANRAKIEKELLEKNKEIAQKLNILEINLKVKEKDGKLFGSITQKDIAEELKNKNFDIREKCIKLEGAIKKIGEYKVKIDLGNNVCAEVNLKIAGIK